MNVSETRNQTTRKVIVMSAIFSVTIDMECNFISPKTFKVCIRK